VVEDVSDGMRQIAAHLVTQGHRHIAAIVTPPEKRNDSWRRARELRNALRALGVDLPDDRIVPIWNEVDLAPVLDRPDPPTALFCWHDRIGYAVLEACDRRAIRIPDELTLIGYDGLHWPSTSPHILTSVAVDIDATAIQAIRILNAQIQGANLPEQTRLLPVLLEPGTTSGPVPL